MKPPALRTHLNQVADLGCLICRLLGLGPTPPQLHHPREGQGAAQRASDWLVVPLCREHHTGDSGVHGLSPRMFERRYGVSELDLVALTFEGTTHARLGLLWEPKA